MRWDRCLVNSCSLPTLTTPAGMVHSLTLASLHPVPSNVPISCAKSWWGQHDGDSLQWDLRPLQCCCHHAGVAAGLAPTMALSTLPGQDDKEPPQEESAWWGQAPHSPTWRSKLREQHDASRTKQAQAASAPPATAPGDGAARAGRQYGDHSSIKRQSCAPSFVLALETMHGTM